MTKKENLEKVLDNLSTVGGIEGSAVVSRDGLIIVSNLPAAIDAETFGAMSATMTGAAETASSELKKGTPDRVLVESKKGKVISVSAGPTAILVALAGPDAKLGLVMLEISKAAKKINARLK